MNTFLIAFMEPGDISNCFFTSFLRCATFAFVLLQVLTHKAAYHRILPEDYVNEIATFTRNIYQFVFKEYYPVCSAWVVTQPFHNIMLLFNVLEDFSRGNRVSQMYAPHRPLFITITRQCLWFTQDVQNVKFRLGPHLNMLLHKGHS